MKTQVHIKQQVFEELVLRKGLTYKDLAETLGINRVYLSNLKNEKCPDFRPSGSLRKKILKALGCQFDDIFLVKQVSVGTNHGAKASGKKASRRPVKSAHASSRR